MKRTSFLVVGCFVVFAGVTGLLFSMPTTCQKSKVDPAVARLNDLVEQLDKRNVELSEKVSELEKDLSNTRLILSATREGLRNVAHNEKYNDDDHKVIGDCITQLSKRVSKLEEAK